MTAPIVREVPASPVPPIDKGRFFVAGRVISVCRHATQMSDLKSVKAVVTGLAGHIVAAAARLNGQASTILNHCGEVAPSARDAGADSFTFCRR